MSLENASRGRFEDWRPYEMPRTLDDLDGPSTGIVTLPKQIFWQNGTKDFDLSDEGDVKVLYQAVISEANAEDQRRYLNKDLLVKQWCELSLPVKAAKAWQSAFPELKGNMRASWAIDI